MHYLIKILLILSPPIATHVAFMPTHTPTSDDFVHENLIEWILLQDANYGLPITKVAISWAIALTELAITASHATDPNIFPSELQAVIVSLRVIQDISITSPFLFGTALIVLGGFIRWWCFRTLGHFFTFKLSVHKGHHLVTSGPYGVVHHPSYAGAALLTIGQFILHGSPSSLARCSGVLNIPALKVIVVAVLSWRMIVAASLILRIRHEDETVKSISRAEWENWAKVVKYHLVPGNY
ncbi:hypothetical protein BDR03DRAFT_1035442 [Suillus americanus]|nr:hypothetical protein BDR03DRAFT_1035442 [Suillus americanus]